MATEENVFIDKQKIDMFIMNNQNYFPEEKIMFLKDKLYKVDESKFSLISYTKLYKPTTIFLLSLFLGWCGVDRFVLKDTAMGILKLISVCCCGLGVIWVIIDLITAHNRAKEKNFNNLMLILS